MEPAEVGPDEAVSVNRAPPSARRGSGACCGRYRDGDWACSRGARRDTESQALLCNASVVGPECVGIDVVLHRRFRRLR